MDDIRKYIEINEKEQKRAKIFWLIEEINELYDQLLISQNEDIEKDLKDKIKEKTNILKKKLDNADIKIFSFSPGIKEKEILEKYLKNIEFFKTNKDRANRKNEQIIFDTVKKISVIARLNKMANKITAETINISEEEIKGEALLYLLKAFLEEMENAQENLETVLNQNKNEEFSSKNELEKEEKKLLKKFLYSFNKYAAWINKEKKQGAKKFFNDWLKPYHYGKIIKNHYNFLQKNKNELPHCQEEINEFLNLFSFLDEKKRDSKK